MELRETLKEVWQNRKKAVIGGVAAVLLLATGAGVVVWKKTTAPQQGVVEEVGDKVTVVTPEGVEVSFNKTLPPGVEEPYCDCLANELRPPEDWLPTRYSKSIWATRDLPTPEEIKAYQERKLKEGLKPQNSKEDLMSDVSEPVANHLVVRFFRERVDVNMILAHYDPQTYVDRIRFEYLGPDYYKGPIPGSRVEEALMERYALVNADLPNAWSPEFLRRSNGRPLAEAPDAYDPEMELLWDQLSPTAQDTSYLNFDKASFQGVILLDYKLDEKGHLKEFTFRPVGRREGFRVHISNPIESFIMNRFWTGYPGYDKNTVAMLPANKANEQYLQDLIRYRQPVWIHLNRDFVRKTPMRLEFWKTHGDFLRIYDPADNKIVMEATIPRADNPKAFVQVYYGGDFVFELSEEAMLYPGMFASVMGKEAQPQLFEEKLKKDPSLAEQQKKYEDEVVWADRRDGRVQYVYRYSNRDLLTLISPPFTGIKEYTGPIKNPYENNPAWKENPKSFARYYGFLFSGGIQ
ncbi:MAG: hypothetical protein KM296_02790 [Brockia lithotrophica]|nr:hypothetical protein [Brockia lithotrophica]